MNNAMAVGNLVDDPVLRFTNSTNRPVCNFTIAINRSTVDGGEHTTYRKCVLWGNLALNFAQSMSKGKRAIVIGRTEARSYDNAGQTVWVEELTGVEAGASHAFAPAMHSSAEDLPDVSPQTVEAF
jgi:single-strand DNA-binding protein